MSEKHAKISAIQSFIAAYAAGDRDGIASVLAEEIEWTIPGHHPLSGTKHGIDEVLGASPSTSRCCGGESAAMNEPEQGEPARARQSMALQRSYHRRRQYVAALGGTPRVSAVFDDEEATAYRQASVIECATRGDCERARRAALRGLADRLRPAQRRYFVARGSGS
jgi:hypothetical protein